MKMFKDFSSSDFLNLLFLLVLFTVVLLGGFLIHENTEITKIIELDKSQKVYEILIELIKLIK